MTTTSKIAKAQAIHRLLPKIKRSAFFEILQQPQEINAENRYWFERVNQTPWEQRTGPKRKAAKAVALKLIRCAVKEKRVAPSDVVDAAIHDPKLTSVLL